MIELPIVVPITLDQSKTVFEFSLESNMFPIALQSDMAVNATIYDAPTYEGDYVVEPSAHNAIVLETKDKLMENDVTVNKIKTSSTTNLYGTTFYIAEVS